MGKVKPFKKGGRGMNTAVVQPVEKNESRKMNCMSNIKKMIQESMKENNLTPEEARKNLGIKRYEKK